MPGLFNATALSKRKEFSYGGSDKEIACFNKSRRKDLENDDFNGSLLYCSSTWDGISCWADTLAGTLSKIPCLEELEGVKYDVKENASRECFRNGTWSSWANYRSCKPLKSVDPELLQFLWDLKDATTVYYVGYGLSLVALLSALCIFFCFKDLRCLRNSIHINLMLTYVFIDITWILTCVLQSSHNDGANRVACYLTILLTYLMGTNYFWMFVEGLYLFVLVVKTFSADNMKISAFFVIGWGLPAAVVATWAVVKNRLGTASYDLLESEVCPWQNKDNYDYIFICPVTVVLLINVVFLGKIMWVLVTKLRAPNTEESRQYRKAAKALLVLVPLLGVTYILLIATPTHPGAEVVFTYIQATMFSLQGFIVAVLYCFLNGEVRKSVKHHFQRWKLRKSVRNGRYALHGTTPSDKSFKFFNRSGKRESTASFTTTTSFVNLHTTAPKFSAGAQEALLEGTRGQEK